MSRETDAVATRQEFEHEHQDGRDRLRMKAHLDLLNDYPFDIGSARYFRRWQEPVETKQKRNELALASGPDHERKRIELSESCEDQPLLGTEFVHAETEVPEDGG